MNILSFEQKIANIANEICNNAKTMFHVIENNNLGESVENATKLIDPRISNNWETMYGLSIIPLLCITYINLVEKIINGAAIIIICYIYNIN